MVRTLVPASEILLDQSYDIRCTEPKSILLKTVIPDWLCRGMKTCLGKQKIPKFRNVLIYNNKVDEAPFSW